MVPISHFFFFTYPCRDSNMIRAVGVSRGKGLVAFTGVMQKLGEKLVTRVSRVLKCTINDVTASRLDRRAGCISQSGLWRKERLAI